MEAEPNRIVKREWIEDIKFPGAEEGKTMRILTRVGIAKFLPYTFSPAAGAKEVIPTTEPISITSGTKYPEISRQKG